MGSLLSISMYVCNFVESKKNKNSVHEISHFVNCVISEEEKNTLVQPFLMKTLNVCQYQE